MIQQKNYKFWFCTGSQDLYGDECLAHVAEHAKIIVNALNASGNLPYEVVWKPRSCLFSGLELGGMSRSEIRIGTIIVSVLFFS